TVTVKDKNGNPIEGLSANDFTVTENGLPQTIRFCEFQKLEAPASTKPAPPGDHPKVAPITAGQITPESPGEIRYKDRRLLALYVDMPAMPVPDQLRAIGAARKFIDTQMTPADLMAILKFSAGAVRVLQDFTDDRAELLKGLQLLTVGEGQGFDEAANDDSAADTGTAFGQDTSEFTISNPDRQMAALETAAKMLGTLHEKKSLIYFSSGLRLNGVNNQAQLQATVNAAMRANVSFYPIDARGLVAQAPLGDATQGSPGGAGMYSGAAAMAATAFFQRSQDTLYTLAADTGGKALF